MHALPLHSKSSRKCSSAHSEMQVAGWKADTQRCARRQLPLLPGSGQGGEEAPPECSSACSFLPLEAASGGKRQEVPNPGMGHWGVCKKVPQCRCCFLQLGPTHPKDFSLAGSGVSGSAIDTVLVVGNFLPSSQAWSTMEEPFPFFASGQGSHWAGSAQEMMLKPFLRVTDDPRLGLEGRHPGLEEEAVLAQCVGWWGGKEGWSQACCAPGWHSWVRQWHCSVITAGPHVQCLCPHGWDNELHLPTADRPIHKRYYKDELFQSLVSYFTANHWYI